MLVTVDEMEAMIQKRRDEICSGVFGEVLNVTDNGFIDTTRGAVLNNATAIATLSKRAEILQKARRQAQIEQEERCLRVAAREERAREVARRMKHLADVWRARLAGMEVNVYRSQLRSIVQRRAHARLRCTQKKNF